MQFPVLPALNVRRVATGTPADRTDVVACDLSVSMFLMLVNAAFRDWELMLQARAASPSSPLPLADPVAGVPTMRPRHVAVPAGRNPVESLPASPNLDVSVVPDTSPRLICMPNAAWFIREP